MEEQRPLPSSIDAERSILGAVLMDNDALSVVESILAPEDFFHQHHSRIFYRMRKMAQAGSPIDLVTLADTLNNEKELEQCGGAAYLGSLCDGMPKISNVEHYSQIVKRKAMLRGIIHAAHAVSEQAFASERPEEILGNAYSRLHQLAEAQPQNQALFHLPKELESTMELSFAIEGFLQNHGATMIGGLSGHGKTLLLLSVTRALLEGGTARKLWGLFPVKETAARVIYLCPEVTLPPFAHRLRLFRLAEFVKSERLLFRTLSKGPTPSLSDPAILQFAKGSHVILDTAVRFAEGDENSAGDNQRGLAADIFRLLAAGARSVIAAHHSPKPFARENTMTLENTLRGSGDVGAMLTTAWAVKQLDAHQNVLHVQNIKPRDFEPCQPFQLIGRPWIDQEGDFRLHKRPGECGTLMEEQSPERDKGGASVEARETRSTNIALLRAWLREDQGQTSEALAEKFRALGVRISPVTVRKYKSEIK